MKTKPVGGHTGSIPKAMKCTPKATTTMFNSKGMKAYNDSDAIPSKAVMDD